MKIIFPDIIPATQLWRRKVADIAKDYKDIKFAIADDEEYMASAMKDFGLDDTGEEFNIGCYKDGKKYGMPPMEEYDSNEIRDFLDRLKKGRVISLILFEIPLVTKKESGFSILIEPSRGKTNNVVSDQV